MLAASVGKNPFKKELVTRSFLIPVSVTKKELVPVLLNFSYDLSCCRWCFCGQLLRQK